MSQHFRSADIANVLITEPRPCRAPEPNGEWPDPQPLPEELPPVMGFDYTLLPESLREWIRDIAERIQCPPDFPAIAAMIVLATVVELFVLW